MQKVERQKHGGRRRRRLTGVILCAVLLIACVTAGILLQRKAQEKPPESRQRIAGSITKRNKEELESITVIQRGKEAWTAVPETDGSLRLRPESDDEPDSWVVDEGIAKMLVDAAVNLTYEDVFTENREEWEPEKDAFGLDEPLITAIIRFTDGTGVTARIGNAADPGENTHYYLTIDGDDRLYAVAAGTVEDLNTEKELLHPVTQPEIRAALLDRITVRNGDGSVKTEWTLQGRIEDQDAAENWQLTAPYTYPADYDAVKNLRDSAENLRVGIYIGNAEEAALKQCGLDKPAAIIELHMAEGSTGTVSESGIYDVEDREEQTVTLTIGARKSDMVAYVLFGEEIYTISFFSIDTFIKTDPMKTVARYAVATPLNSLDSVTVEKQGEETVQYILDRTAADSGTESTGENDGESRYRCLRNGEEISWDTFSAAWERLLTVTVSGRLPKDFERGEAHTKYTFRTVSGGTHTVELCDYDGMHDAVVMDGYALFYLIRGGMTALP